MLQIVQFEDGRYGVQNKLTGILLPNRRRTKVATFRTLGGAERHIRYVNRRLNKVIRRIGR